MKHHRKRNITILILALITAALIILLQHQKVPYRSARGMTFGTVYYINYQCNDTLNEEIETVFRQFNKSLSMFDSTSIVSRINRNEPVEVDSLFEHCFRKAMEVSRITNGDFDITVCPLVNSWGFGFKSQKFPDDRKIKDLMQYIGYKKVRLEGKYVVKENSKIMLDFSAIAKGYAVDAVSNMLLSKGVKNFMVDIGGEVRIMGLSAEKNLWKIGIDNPTDDVLSTNNELEDVLYITDKAVATSGNYRNFYYHNGKKYSHEINPHTGYPAFNEILSSTVIAKDCATADAFATAIMIKGLKHSQQMLARLKDIDAYIIYRDNKGKNRIYYSKGISKYLKNK